MSTKKKVATAGLYLLVILAVVATIAIFSMDSVVALRELARAAVLSVTAVAGTFALFVLAVLIYRRPEPHAALHLAKYVAKALLLQIKVDLKKEEYEELLKNIDEVEITPFDVMFVITTLVCLIAIGIAGVLLAAHLTTGRFIADQLLAAVVSVIGWEIEAWVMNWYNTLE